MSTNKVILDPQLTVAENHAKAFFNQIEAAPRTVNGEILTVDIMTEIFQRAIDDARFMSGQH